MSRFSQPAKPSARLKRTARMADEAFERLRTAILNGTFKEGDEIREIRLVREWNVGRTPLREAIRRAAEFGYLVLRPNRAPVIRRLSGEDILQIYALRERLECFALESAWPYLEEDDFSRLDQLEIKAETTTTTGAHLRALWTFDDELHRLWIAKSKNPWLVSALDRLMIYRPTYHLPDASILSDHYPLLEVAFQDHKQILAAMKKRDLPRALEVLRQHIARAGVTLARLHYDREGSTSS